MEREMADIEAQTNGNEGHDSAAIFKKANNPVTLKFVDVNYKVKLGNPKSNMCRKDIKSEEKVILKGVSGLVLPGEILAMLGPSGSGKTTLLTGLGGKLDGQLGGSITYNRNPFSNIIKRNMGFVTQDDILYPHLTVTETLVFGALLRLPNSLTKDEKIMHAEAVIAQLGLTRCKNIIIGGEFLRGVSGGERKRVSIGQELLINPSLLFLDEPTSGLDSTMAQRIVSILRELAKGGRTVAMTIHQPSSRLFYMFDKVLLLSEGTPMYFGEGSKAMDYFSNIGYAPSLLISPSEFLLDLANGVSPNNDSWESPAVVKQALFSSYKVNILDKLKENIDEIDDYCQDKSSDEDSARWATTWWQQFSVLFRRGIKERKYETFSGIKIAQVLVLSFLSGFLWWKTSNLQDQIGLLFFYSGFWGFFPLFEAIFTFPEERRMLAKERSSRTYRLSAYFMSRMVSDLPIGLVLPTISVAITYWMAGLKPTAVNFFHTLFVLLYSVLVSQGLGLALGALVMDQKAATTLGSVIMLTFQLAGGYFVQHVPAFIAWIKYISIIKHTFKLLLGSQYNSDSTYPCGSGNFCWVGEYPSIKMVGLGGQVTSAIAVGIMLVGFRVIAYLALLRVGVTKK